MKKVKKGVAGIEAPGEKTGIVLPEKVEALSPMQRASRLLEWIGMMLSPVEEQNVPSVPRSPKFTRVPKTAFARLFPA